MFVKEEKGVRRVIKCSAELKPGVELGYCAWHSGFLYGCVCLRTWDVE